MTTLAGKTLFITGGSRGIGLAIALRAARDGANIAIAAKTSDPNPKLPGTVHTAAAEIEAAGGRALPIVCDIRFEDQVVAAVEQTAATFGGIDICVNNASALSPTGTEATDMKRFDLMHAINTRGTFLTTKTCIPYLRKAQNPHVLVLSPPLDLQPKWFKNHVAYSIAKYGMSLCVLGMAEEFRKDGIAVNALWPRTAIATAAIENVLGRELIAMSRTPDIMADAAHLILTQPSRNLTGQFLIDDSVLYEKGGVTDFSPYRVDASKPLVQDFFVPEDRPPPPGVKVIPMNLPGS
jgi:citronellol/citronellal dehydrogenase